MNRSAVRAAVVLGSLAALVLGSVSSQAQMKPGTGDPVADRQRLMKLNGTSWKDVQDKVKAGQIEAVAVNAETLAMNAEHIPSLFPKGSLTDKSKAKPDIWEKFPEFEAAAGYTRGLDPPGSERVSQVLGQDLVPSACD